MWILEALSTVEVLVKDAKHTALLNVPDEGRRLVREQAHRQIEILKRLPNDTADSNKGAKLLLASLTLHHYCCGDDDGNYNEVLQVFNYLQSGQSFFDTDRSIVLYQCNKSHERTPKTQAPEAIEDRRQF